MSGTTKITAPYGTWPSPLSAADLAGASVGFTDLSVDGDDVYWLQSDPNNGGRHAVMRYTGEGPPMAISPEGFNARTRVGEYGGGALGVGDGVVLACSWDDQRVYRLTDGGVTAVTPEPDAAAGIRWAAMQVLPGGGAFVAIRETHGSDRPRDNSNVHGKEEAVNEVVTVDLDNGQQTVLVTGPDFVSGPWVNPAGTRMAWLQWDHPDMPWDTAQLWLADLTSAGLGTPTHVAGGKSAVSDVHWADDDRLLFSDDTSGWWNVYIWDEGTTTRLQDESVDSGGPRWQLGRQGLTTLDGQIYVLTMSDGYGRLWRIGDGPLALDGIGWMAAVAATSDAVVVIGGGPARPMAVLAVDPSTAQLTPLSPVVDDPAARIGAAPRSISFDTPDGATAHGLYYAPTSSTHVGPDDRSPPLIVLTHGGPTGAALPVLNRTAQYWVSRGFAVVDVNYRGSVGYGREFRDALKGNWGVHDVTDCIAAATYLAEQGLADIDRLIIEGGSAGGFTTLLALCTTDTFAAGGSSFGVADLRALATDTHKFESRYLDSMVGPWPEDEAVYVDRSPITHVDSLSTPLIVLQGDEDAVVPPDQAEVIVQALRRRNIPHAYLLFEGEQHGFRKAENIARALEARLGFYGQVLGFDPADDIHLPEFVAAH